LACHRRRKDLTFTPLRIIFGMAVVTAALVLWLEAFQRNAFDGPDLKAVGPVNRPRPPAAEGAAEPLSAFNRSEAAIAPHYRPGRMPPLLGDACDWLDHAEEAQKAAEQLTDREAKEVMLQLAQLYLRLAQTAFTQARAREG
jgi:hypothetical protein